MKKQKSAAELPSWMQKVNLRWLNRTWVRVALTLVMMALVLLWIKPAEIWRTIRTSNPALLLWSMALTPVVIGIKTLRWLLLAHMDAPVSFREALRSYLAGLTLATVTPLAAGEIARGMFVRNGNRAALTGKALLDKIVDLSAAGLFAGGGLLMTGESTARIVGGAILGVVLAAWIAALALLPLLGRLATHMTGGWLVRLNIPAVVRGLASTSLSRLGLNMLLALVGFTVFYSQTFIVLRAFSATAPWSVIPYFPVITLSTLLPIGLGGTGVREWTAVLLLRRFGVAESAAFNAFLAHFLIVQVLPALAGAVIIGSFHRKATLTTVTAQQEGVVAIQKEEEALS